MRLTERKVADTLRAALASEDAMAKRLLRLAAKLKEARKKAGLTRTAAAEAAGISQSYWTLMEQGQRDPLQVYLDQRDQLERIAAAVGLTLDDLLES